MGLLCERAELVYRKLMESAGSVTEVRTLAGTLMAAGASLPID